MSKQLDVDVTSGARKTDLWGIFSIKREISRFMKLHLGEKKIKKIDRVREGVGKKG